MAGRLVYIVCHAAGVHGLGETPEARILAGTANALADIAETPAELERQRQAERITVQDRKTVPHLNSTMGGRYDGKELSYRGRQ